MTTKPNVLIISDSAHWQLQACQLISKFFDLANYHLVYTVSDPPVSPTWNFPRIEFSLFDESNPVRVVEGGPTIDKYDLILSLHCQQILPDWLVNKVRCINVHPGYLPWGKGWRPVAFALANRTPAGASIHEMDAQIDHGPVIVRERVFYEPHATAKEVYEEIQDAEKRLLWDNFPQLLAGRYESKLMADLQEEEDVPPWDAQSRFKSDYDRLCDLGMLVPRHDGCMRFLGRLAGLTYGDQANAFFTTANGEKYRVGIFMEKVEENDKARSDDVSV